MIGDYRLFRQVNGFGAFAHIYVEVLNWDGQGDQILASSEIKIQAPIDLEWLAGAIKGCAEALNAIKLKGINIEHQCVYITQMLTTDIDTTANATYAAAFLATIKAWDMLDEFKPVSPNDWKVLFNNRRKDESL